MLSGCVQGSTYGTGKTQEQQLVNDLTGILGGDEDKPNIQYVERPNIVKPANTAALPTPSSEFGTNAQAWPESPDNRLQRLRADLESDDALTRARAKRELQKMDNVKREGARQRQRARFASAGIDPDKTELTSQEQRTLFRNLRDQRRASRTGSTDGQRRYLSEPPTEYRQPAQTATVGNVGLTERQKRACLKSKGRTGIFGVVRSRNKKRECAAYLASLNLVEQRNTQ